MNLLLDTHALLWWFTDDRKLSVHAKNQIADEANTIFVSAASAWEIATKQRIGKLNDIPEVSTWFAELVVADEFRHLPVTYLHSLKAGHYDLNHRDPFDRMLAAQAELESLELVSCDSAFQLFSITVVW